MKKYPLRTCIGCRIVERKDKLMRLVVNDQGEVVVDKSGRLAGRGAYVCNRDCLQKALQQNRLHRALRLKFSPKLKLSP